MGVLETVRSHGVSYVKTCSRRLRGGGGSGEGACACDCAGGRLAARLLTCLLHISCLLALFGGAGLAMCARLKWDPSAYVVLRNLFPREYRAVCVALPLGCAVAVALGHLAVCARLARRPARRRLLLRSYGALTLALAAGECALAGWLAARLARWLRSPQARRVLAALDFKDHVLGPALSFLGRFIPASWETKALMDEMDADVPYNVYVACGAGAALLLLQLAAAALALLAARAPRPRPAAAAAPHGGGSLGYIEMAPLRGAPRSRSPLPLLTPVL